MLRSRVAGDIAVRCHHTIAFKIEPFRCRDVNNFLPKRAGLNGHFVNYTGHLIDKYRTGASDIDDDRRIKFFAI